MDEFQIGQRVQVVDEPEPQYAAEFPGLIQSYGTIDGFFGDKVVVRFAIPFKSVDGLLTQEIMVFDPEDLKAI